jgi:hypothetical protein
MIDPFERLAQVPLADVIGKKLTDGKVCCPFHDDSTPSCHIYADHFHCFACGAHGDHITWLIEVEGLSRDEAIETLLNWSGPVARPQSSTTNNNNIERALRLWEAGQPITGTLAAQYLKDRRKITRGPTHPENILRFHPHCPFGGETHPCLIALFRDVETDEPAGIHRIALTPELLAGTAKVQRRMLGQWPRPRAFKLWSAGTTLTIGEGIETCLGAATLCHRGAPLRPWALGSSTGIERFPLIRGIEHLNILVDRDANNVGINAARTCAARWIAAGRRVALLIPHAEGDDFNDLVQVAVP